MTNLTLTIILWAQNKGINETKLVAYTMALETKMRSFGRRDF